MLSRRFWIRNAPPRKSPEGRKDDTRQRGNGMKCPNCGTENPEGARYCQTCGYDSQPRPHVEMKPSWAGSFPVIYEVSRIGLTWQTGTGLIFIAFAFGIAWLFALSWLSLTVQVILMFIAYWAIRGQFSRSYLRPSYWRVYLLIRK